MKLLINATNFLFKVQKMEEKNIVESTTNVEPQPVSKTSEYGATGLPIRSLGREKEKK